MLINETILKRIVMRKTILSLFLALPFYMTAQDHLYLYMKNGDINEYLISDVDSIVFQERESDPYEQPIEEPVIVHEEGTTPQIVTVGDVEVLRSGGWFESGFAEWKAVADASGYNVYYKKSDAGAFSRIDAPLVRSYKDCVRADILGVAAGSYEMKIAPVIGGKEGSATVVKFDVAAHDRAGFAHFNNSGVGAYKDDGTLKEGAIVLYVTEKNKNTISQDIYTSSGKTTSCTGISAICSALQKGYETRPVCIRLIGKVTADGMTGSGDSNNLLIKSSTAGRPAKNITVEGVGDDATCYGFGVRCVRVQSVEIRNLGIMLFGDDGIAFETENKYVWVHHNDIFYGTAGGDADQAKGDGSLDLKNDSQYMTLSYNHFWDSGKMSLCGMKSETGPNYISYHHNWFDHSDSRHPRVRTMSVHVYNNYFDGVAKYGVGVTYGASVFVEANYFRNVSKPMLASKQGTDAKGAGTFSGEDGGVIKSFNNYYAENPSSFSFITYKENPTSFDAYEASSRTEQVPAAPVLRSIMTAARSTAAASPTAPSAATATAIWKSGTTSSPSSTTTATATTPSLSRRTSTPAWVWSVWLLSVRMLTPCSMWTPS